MYASDHVKCSSACKKVVREACAEEAGGSPTISIYDFEDHLDGGTENISTRDWLTNTIVSNLVRKST